MDSSKTDVPHNVKACIIRHHLQNNEDLMKVAKPMVDTIGKLKVIEQIWVTFMQPFFNYTFN
jgi:hypothetical protein